MKKRLRKKLHKGEYRELGFELKFDYTGDAGGQESIDQFNMPFIEAIENIGLMVGGGGCRHHDYFVARYRASVLPEQRQAVIDWLGQRPDVANIVAGPLKDAWYGWNKE